MQLPVSLEGSVEGPRYCARTQIQRPTLSSLIVIFLEDSQDLPMETHSQ